MINHVKRSLNERLILRLETSFDGIPWHGKSVMAIIKSSEMGLPARALELINHMVAWRSFVTSALNEKAYKIALNTPADWPPVHGPEEEIIQELLNSQIDLIKAISSFSNDRWHTKPAEAPYTYYQLCHGIIDHDIYHSAQIATALK